MSVNNRWFGVPGGQPGRGEGGPAATDRRSTTLRSMVGVPAVLAVCLLSACGGADAADDTEPLETTADEIAGYAESIVDEARVPAVAIGIVTPDGLVEQRFVGQNHNGDPVTADTAFEIGSATKAFLGITQAILVDRGELDWDDRVVDHRSDFTMHDPWVTEEFRVVDLLAQRSGMPEYAAEQMYEFGFPWSDNVDLLATVEPETSFRSGFAYQNIPHYVAGQIVADKISAVDWNAAAAEMIFEPLEMTGTVTHEEALVDAPDSTRGHTVRDGMTHQRPLGAFPSGSQGAGSIVSNLEDMSKWVAMHLSRGEGPGGRLVSEEQLEETYRPRIAVADDYFAGLIGMGSDRLDIGYATGWFVHSTPEGRVIEHGGNTMGYNSAVMFDPDREVGLIVLSNQGFQGGSAGQIGKYGMDLLQGRTPQDHFAREQVAREEAVAAEAAAVEELAAGVTSQDHPADWYEGTYVNPHLGELVFRAEGGELRTGVGPRDFEATGTRVAGSTFELSWHLEGAPEAELTTAIAEFDDSGDQPDRVEVDGFVFDRTAG